MIKQLRASGGMWLSHAGTNILIDPGPGSLVRCVSARPALDPGTLDAIILTHKHLDHSNDINVMIEAMTEGGFKKRGVVFAPSDACGASGVIMPYLRDFPEKIIPLKEGDFELGTIRFTVPVRNQHSGETYGLKFFLGTTIVSFVGDTRYFDHLLSAYRDSSVLVLNVVFLNAAASMSIYT
ncbi:MAG: MBL fold metallo-hydrolase [Candidatus Omnitrophota bacterium]